MRDCRQISFSFLFLESFNLSEETIFLFNCVFIKKEDGTPKMSQILLGSLIYLKKVNRRAKKLSLSF